MSIFSEALANVVAKLKLPLVPDIHERVVSQFQARTREIFAALNQSRDEVGRKMYAYARLHILPETEGQIDAKTLDAQVDLTLLSLIENGSLTWALSPLPQEAQAELDALRERVSRAGLRPSTAPAVAAAAEAEPIVDPDVEAIAYYNTHSTGDVKARMRREPDFAARVVRLQETNRV